VVNVTNPLGNPTIYDYDVLNRLTRVNDPLNGLTQFGYDPNGNLLSVTDARNNSTIYTYENMDRLATRHDPLLRTESYQYDLAGNMTQFTDRKSQPTSYTYDGLNRRTGVTYADSSTTAYTYDKGNRLTQAVDSIAGTITRSYDGLNRLTQETTPQGSVSYTYDAASRRAGMTVFGQPSVSYSYDNANRLIQITQGSSTVTYTYDAAGRRNSLTLPNAVLVEYAYDTASRLTSITYKQNGTVVLGNLTYEYDKNGNRTKTGGSFARTGIPQAISSTAYDAANQQTTFADKTLTYDNNGNLQTITDTGGTTTYTWNARNQLIGISGPTVSASFVYDGLGKRESKTVNGNLTEFLYDGQNPVQETSGATVLANILPGLRIDEFLIRTDIASGVTSYFLADVLGSPVAVTDASGTVQTEYTYEPFGQTTLGGASNSNPYQYTGRENDGTGLYYYRARYYHPQLQRFISEDPIGFTKLPQSFNKYSYVLNEPTDYVDPLGLSRKEPEGPPCPPTGCPPPPCPPAGCMPPDCPLAGCMPPDCPLGFANCLYGGRPQGGGPQPGSGEPARPDYSDICKYGCTTDQGAVYPNGSDEPVGDPKFRGGQGQLQRALRQYSRE
jgi:RHS repeat-associated protein